MPYATSSWSLSRFQFKRNYPDDDDSEDIIAVRASNQRGRQRCGILLATSFVIVVTVVVSTVWSTRWSDRDVPSLLQPPTVTTRAPTPSTSSNNNAPTTTVVVPTVGCNGLENLCTTPVSQVLFATAHNAAATASVQLVAPNHDQSLLQALQAGYRGLNIDVGLCSDGQLRLVHGSCALGTDDLAARLREIAAFVGTQKRDVFLVTMELNMGSGGVFTVAFLENWIRQNVPEFVRLLYPGPPADGVWPTVDELTNAGTPLLLFHYGAPRCDDCPPGFLEWFDYAIETPFAYDTPAELLRDTATSCAVTRGLAGSMDWYGVNVFTRVPSRTSCQVLNARANLQAHLEACETLLRRPVSAVLVDCWDQGDVLAVVQVMNARR